MLKILLALLRYGFLLALFSFIYKVISIIDQDIKGIASKNEQLVPEEFFYSPKEPQYTSHSMLEKLDNERKFNLIIPITTLGRGEHNHIIIDDNYTSYEHARIVYQEEKFCLEDLQSTNGTFLNGVRIKERVDLQDGDQVKIGETIFVFRR